MKGKTVIVALVLSVALCSQGFSFELLDRLMGTNCGGCGECNACAKVACCDPVVKCCAPEPKCCEKPMGCEKACEPSCNQCATPIRDLFAGMKGLFECKKCCKAECGCAPEACERVKVCDPEPACRVKACDPVCVKACEPKCVKVKACEPACVKACEPACEKACGCEKGCRCKQCRPILSMLEDLFACKKCSCNSGCEVGCEVGCEAGCGGCSNGGAPTKVEKTTKPVSEETTLFPVAPSPDPKASVQRSNTMYQTSRSVVRN